MINSIIFFLVSLLTLEFASPIDPNKKKAQCKFKNNKLNLSLEIIVLLFKSIYKCTTYPTLLLFSAQQDMAEMGWGMGDTGTIRMMINENNLGKLSIRQTSIGKLLHFLNKCR